jgi:nitrogen fixation NifU-like protein
VYSERLRELFRSAAHAGRLEGATHYGEAGTPGGGPYIQLWLRVEGGIVQGARFKTYGCPAAIACAEAACAWSEGTPLRELGAATASSIAGRVGGVPEGKEHCPELAALALRTLRLTR